MARTRNTGLTQRTAAHGFGDPVPVEAEYLGTLTSMRGVDWTNHARTFNTPEGKRLTVWWFADDQTGAVRSVIEDTRGLN